MSETGKCSECGAELSFYDKPGGPKGKMEAFCQVCHGIREKDEGRPESLEKETFEKHREVEKKKISDAKKEPTVEK